MPLPNALHLLRIQTAAVLGLLLVAAVAAADAPVIFWASSPVRPNETVILAGHSLAGATDAEGPTVVEIGAYPAEDVGTPGSGSPEPKSPTDWRVVETLRKASDSVAAVVPADWPEGLWACRVRRGDAASAPVMLNAADAWWVQGDQGDSASPGGSVQIFGKALALQAANARAVLRSAADGSTVALELRQATPYAVSAAVPSSCPAGSFEVLIHNGLGGSAGWQPAGSMMVEVPRAWKPDRFNVRDFGTVSEKAIRAALAKAAENGGGVVFLPRGRYGLTEPLAIPDGVVLAGESRELVSLFWKDFDSPPPALIAGKRFGVQDLSVYCQQHRDVIVLSPGSDGSFIRRVRIRANCHFMIEHPGKPFRDHMGPQSNRNLGAGIAVKGRNFEITDCDVLASDFALYLVNARHGRITGNTFLYGGRGYRIESSREIIFADNTVEGFDLTAIGNDISTFWSNACTHLYFAKNRLRRMFGADREMMTLDAAGSAYVGTLESVAGNCLTLAADPVYWDYAPKPHSNWVGSAATVLAGRGAGQYAIVTGHNGRAWEIDREWAVQPDKASMVAIAPFRGRNLFIGNECEDGGPFQLYGAAHECIVAENSGRRMDGFLVWGLDPHGRGMQPTWYSQFLDNVILEGNAYGHRAGGFGTAAAGKPENGRGASVRAVIYRRNECKNNAGFSIGGNLSGALVEHNTVADADLGITVRLPAAGVVLRGNRFENVVKPMDGDGLSEAMIVP